MRKLSNRDDNVRISEYSPIAYARKEYSLIAKIRPRLRTQVGRARDSSCTKATGTHETIPTNKRYKTSHNPNPKQE